MYIYKTPHHNYYGGLFRNACVTIISGPGIIVIFELPASQIVGGGMQIKTIKLELCRTCVVY